MNCCFVFFANYFVVCDVLAFINFFGVYWMSGMKFIGRFVTGHAWFNSVADPGGAVWGNFPPQTSVVPRWMASLCHKCATFWCL